MNLIVVRLFSFCIIIIRLSKSYNKKIPYALISMCHFLGGYLGKISGIYFRVKGISNYMSTIDIIFRNFIFLSKYDRLGYANIFEDI